MSATHPPWFTFPSHLEGLDRFEPGKPIGEVQRELGLTDVVKLASNAFLMTRTPVAAPPRENQLPFPFNVRLTIAGWNLPCV